MSVIDNKVEILRALERTKEQFEVQYQKNCEGNNNRKYPEYSDADKEFMEEFKKVYELGITQLQDFVNKLDRDGSEIDEYSLLYYITQLANGPYSQEFALFSQNKIDQNTNNSIFNKSPDCLGSITNSIQTNSSVPVFRSESLSTGVSLFNKSPNFVQDLLGEASRNTAEVFNFNFESSVFNDNTLPYIDKAPRARANIEGAFSYGAAPLGFTEIANLAPQFLSQASTIVQTGIQTVIGQIAVNANNFITEGIRKMGNLNASTTDSVIGLITNQTISDVTTANVNVIRQAAGRLELDSKNINVETQRAMGIISQEAYGVLAADLVPSDGIITGLTNDIVPSLANRSKGIVQNSSALLLGAGENVVQQAFSELQNGIGVALNASLNQFNQRDILVNSKAFDNIVENAKNNLQNFIPSVLGNLVNNLGAAVNIGLGGPSTLLGGFCSGVVGGVFGSSNPNYNRSPVNALVAGENNWAPGVATANLMLKDTKMHSIIAETTKDIFSMLQRSLGPAFRLLLFKKTFNYFNKERNKSRNINNVTRLLNFLKEVRSESGNLELQLQCEEIETSLQGSSLLQPDLTVYNPDGPVNLYTNEGRLGNQSPVKEEIVGRDLQDEFTNVAAATARALEIGCSGYHIHLEDGNTYYMPCSSMKEYQTLTDQLKEEIDPNNPLVSEVDCLTAIPMEERKLTY